MEGVLGTGARGAGNARAPSWGAAAEGRGSPPGVQEKVFLIVSFTWLNLSVIQGL